MPVNDLFHRAHHKAFAKLSMLTFEIDNLKDELKTGCSAGVTKEELALMLESSKIEYEVWNYILETIEKNN